MKSQILRTKLNYFLKKLKNFVFRSADYFTYSTNFKIKMYIVCDKSQVVL